MSNSNFDDNLDKVLTVALKFSVEACLQFGAVPTVAIEGEVNLDDVKKALLTAGCDFKSVDVDVDVDGPGVVISLEV